METMAAMRGPAFWLPKWILCLLAGSTSLPASFRRCFL
jgi:hypothetical protein